MDTVPALVPRDAFIAVYMMSNGKQRHGEQDRGHPEREIAEEIQARLEINLIAREKPHWSDLFLS
ncbi:MAG: hypothetical protein ACREHV_01500, partial [Rhizomicrobium sp.]